MEPRPEHARVLDRVRRALRSEPRVDLAGHPIRLEYDGATLVMEGEVADIAAKKLALGTAARLPEIAHIADRLRVRPAEPMGDGHIRDRLRDALLQEPEFADLAIRSRARAEWEVDRAPAAPAGGIDAWVAEGVVTLSGEVPSLRRKRLAGVLAWFVRGTRDVVNGLAVADPAPDSDDEMTRAVRLALDKDPVVNAAGIRIVTERSVVTLAGIVGSDLARRAAVADAWYVFGVDRVIDRLEVRP